jgi:hypothetical protein
MLPVKEKESFKGGKREEKKSRNAFFDEKILLLALSFPWNIKYGCCYHRKIYIS